VYESTHRRAFSDDRPHSRKMFEQVNVIEQGGAETVRSFLIVFRDVSDDLGEVV